VHGLCEADNPEESREARSKHDEGELDDALNDKSAEAKGSPLGECSGMTPDTSGSRGKPRLLPGLFSFAISYGASA
jgi:hypothetical protein